LSDEFKLHRKPTDKPKRLTDKQKQTVLMVMQGLRLKEIAGILNHNVNTVNDRVTHMLERYNVRSSTALITKLIQMGYIDPQKVEVKGR